jgi:hypothetical protein
MTTRARTSSTPAKTAAAPAKKPAPKKPTPKRTRAPRAKAATPALSLVKTPDPAQDTDSVQPAHAPAPTLVDLNNPLRMRRRPFVGPLGATEQAAVRAALAAATARLPIPVRTWNGSTARLADGVLVIHNPGPDRLFTAHIACGHGAIHGWPIRTYQHLREARALTHACERPHATATTHEGTELHWDTAITHGVGPVPQPKPSIVLALREGIRRAEATKADTQPLAGDAIADGLATRAADTETAKEHPES